MLHLETGNYKLDFTQRSSLFELLPEKKDICLVFISAAGRGPSRVPLYGCQLLCDGEERELLSGLYTKEYEFLFDDVWTDTQCRFFERYFKKDVLEDEYELFIFIRYFDLVKEEYNTLDGYSLFMNRIVLADQLLNKYGINLSMVLQPE